MTKEISHAMTTSSLVIAKQKGLFSKVKNQTNMKHKNPNTTQIYTHVSKEQLGKIISPLDKLKLNE